MIIEIDDELFHKVKQIVKGRNTQVFEQLEQLQEIQTKDTLKQARTIKTQRVKQSIKETITSLYSQDIQPTKYKIHKSTGIAYITLNKYYDEIIKEVRNAEDER